MESTKVVVKKLINASCEEVFEAWSNPEQLKKWFFPSKSGWKAISAHDFKVGGQYRHEMCLEMGPSYVHTGIYKEIIPHKKISFTWNSHIVKDTLVTVELKPVDGMTEVTVIHELTLDRDIQNRHREGWHSCLGNLMKYFSKQNYQCHMSYQKPAEDVFKALTSEKGLKGWWTTDCSVEPLKIGAKNTFRFGPTFTVMKVTEVIPNKKVIWECINHNHINPDLKKTDEWIGTKLIFQLEENKKDTGTLLHFTQEGLIPLLECFSICENRWDYFLKESLKSYVETGLGGPYQE